MSGQFTVGDSQKPKARTAAEERAFLDKEAKQLYIDAEADQVDQRGQKIPPKQAFEAELHKMTPQEQQAAFNKFQSLVNKQAPIHDAQGRPVALPSLQFIDAGGNVTRIDRLGPGGTTTPVFDSKDFPNQHLTRMTAATPQMTVGEGSAAGRPAESAAKPPEAPPKPPVEAPYNDPTVRQPVNPKEADNRAIARDLLKQDPFDPRFTLFATLADATKKPPQITQESAEAWLQHHQPLATDREIDRNTRQFVESLYREWNTQTVQGIVNHSKAGALGNAFHVKQSTGSITEESLAKGAGYLQANGKDADISTMDRDKGRSGASQQDPLMASGTYRPGAYPPPGGYPKQ